MIDQLSNKKIRLSGFIEWVLGIFHNWPVKNCHSLLSILISLFGDQIRHYGLDILQS